MMKKRPNSPRDLQLLSAYLDGQLSHQEVARLRLHMQRDPQMQVALEDLRATRAALRSLPRLRAPRNFTLTRQMVGARAPARRPAYPVFGYASLVASLLLVIVFVSDRMSFLNTAQTAALESAAQATQMEQVVQTMVVESLAAEGASVPESDAMAKEAPLAAMPAEEEASRIAEPTPEVLAEAMALAYPEPTLMVMSEPAVEALPPLTLGIQETGEITSSVTLTPTTTAWGIGGGPLAPSETPLPSLTPEPSSTPEPTPTGADALMSDAAQPKLPASQAPAAPAALETSPSTPPRQTLTLAVEIGLALVAAGSALVFIYLYRKANG